MTRPVISIRKATFADIPALETLINAAFKLEAFFVSGNRIDAPTLQLEMKKGQFLMAETNQALLGCVYLELENKSGYFGMLSVDPLKQGSGIGRLLIQTAEGLASAHGCTQMIIRIVNLREELPAFYRKLGYSLTGETAPFPREIVIDRPCYFVGMSKPLSAAVNTEISK